MTEQTTLLTRGLRQDRKPRGLPPSAVPANAPRIAGGRAVPLAVLQGSLDRAERDGTVEGWCWSPTDPGAHRTVAVWIDQREVARARCDNRRDDLRAAGIGDGDHGFLVCLAAGDMAPGATVSLALHDAETGQRVGGPRQVTWPTHRAELLAWPVAHVAPTAIGPLRGTLDRVTRDGWVSGWTWDPTQPETRVALDILVDGDVVGTTVAAGFRADLQAAGIGDGAHGFSFALPYDVLAARGTLRVAVRERCADGSPGRPLDAPVELRIGRLAAAEQRVQDVERQVRLLRGQLDALTREAVERPQSDQRAAQLLFGTVAGFFRELADGTAPAQRGFGAAPFAGGGLRGAIDDITTRLSPLTLRVAERPVANVCIPATASVEAVHRCLMALHEAGIDALADVTLLEPPDADPRVALLPSIVRNLNFVHLAPGTNLVAGCDEAARSGRGAYAAFLSPDCLPMRGWLSEMIDTFGREPAAAVVGAVVARADGLLQHAGFEFAFGGLLRDPGQFAEADRPEYRFLRQVDAVAGLAFAVERKRFVAGGGFSRQYATLTGAVVDFCARLRRGGGVTLLQPAAGATWADTADTDSGRTLPDLSLPDEEARRLRLAVLAAPELAEPDHVGHALVVDDEIPRPDRDAGSIVTMEQLRVLRSLGWRVTFAPASGGAVSAQARLRLEREGFEVATPPHWPSVTHYLREHGASLDLVQIYRHANATVLTERVREFAPTAKLVFAPADLHHVRELREAALTGRDRARADATRVQELACVRGADATLVHSDHEVDVLAAEFSIDADRLLLLRWIVRPVAAPAAFAARDGIAFVANFGHPPNLDAMLWFCAEVMPELRRIRPGIVLHIVGADPPPSIRALAAEDVRVRGWLADLDGLLGQVRLTVAPLRYGAGFKGKVATSLAHGVPAVVTPSAAEGMGLADGDGVVVVPAEAGAFAAAVALAHDDAEAWSALSSKALERVVALYGPAAGRRTYAGLLGRLNLPARLEPG